MCACSVLRSSRVTSPLPGTFIAGDFLTLKSVLGTDKNWTPLVKEWNVPTGESVYDHVVTLFANVFKTNKGTLLPCNHTIPNNTFPLERYNGCPFCGTPFEPPRAGITARTFILIHYCFVKL